MIKAILSDSNAEEIASELVSGYTETEEDDGTLEKAVADLAYFLVSAIRDFNEERERKARNEPPIQGPGDAATAEMDAVADDEDG